MSSALRARCMLSLNSSIKRPLDSPIKAMTVTSRPRRVLPICRLNNLQRRRTCKWLITLHNTVPASSQVLICHSARQARRTIPFSIVPFRWCHLNCFVYNDFPQTTEFWNSLDSALRKLQTKHLLRSYPAIFLCEHSYVAALLLYLAFQLFNLVINIS